MKAVAEIAKNIIPGTSWQPEAFPPRRIVPGQRITLDSLKDTHPLIKLAKKTCHSWAQRKRDGYADASLVVVGPVGTGKTHIAKALVWSIYNSLEDGTPVAPIGRLFLANDLIQALTADYRPGNFIPSDCPILAIDDVGTEQRIPYVSTEAQPLEMQARYFKAIDHCYNWGISLVITSNLSLARLEQHLGPRNWSRLKQMAPAGFMLDLAGVPDYRHIESGRVPA